MTKAKDDSITVLEIQQGRVEFCVLGTSPLIFNRMTAKARRDLLLGTEKKNKAERAANLKHTPPDEFRNSAGRIEGDDTPARLCIPAPAFKGALASAALDMPGTRKSEIGRLSWVEGYHIPIFGRPELLMSVVRSADIAKTPDIRTRAILPEWACRVTISFVRPILKETAVANLLAAAGVTIGVGDFRQEKGKGSFGQFRLVDADNEDYLRITQTMGRVVQDEALADPIPHDADSEELLAWYQSEVLRRGRMAA